MPRRASPVPPHILAADHSTVTALRHLIGYAPLNQDLSIEALLRRLARLSAAKQVMADISAAMDAARRELVEASHDYHEAVVDARTQVVAQYGPDAAEVAMIGLTRKSKRRQSSTSRHKGTTAKLKDS